MNINETFFATPDPTVPSQSAMVTNRVLVRPKYAIIPASVLTNLTNSILPYWQNYKCWVLTTPAIGFGTGFAEYIMFLEPGGGSDEPELEDGVESFIFILDGCAELYVEKDCYEMVKGGYAFLPSDKNWRIHNRSNTISKFLWIRKAYEPIRDLKPCFFIGNERETPQVEIENFDGMGYSQYLFPRNDTAYDMNINLNNWMPGSKIPVVETHIMEHGLYMLQGQGVYLLNEEWHEVNAGDFIWMAPFCPQAFYCGGRVPARYLLYKNMNRQFSLQK